MIVALTGATGYVGRFIVQRLVREGAHIRAWRRATSDLSGLPREIEWIEGSLASPASMAALVAGADALVHAALEHVPGRYRGGEGDDPPRFRALNGEGSIALLRQAREAGLRRAMVLSSRAVFGAAVAGDIPDDHPTAPDSLYGAVKAALEAVARESDWPIAVVRPTGVYGVVDPPDRSKWLGLVRDALAGRPVEPRAATEVHGGDVAGAVRLLLNAPAESVTGQVFNCSDLVVSHRDIVREVQRITGVAGPLPEEGTPPAGILRSDALESLGMRFGGRALFERTVAELVAAARAKP